MTACLSRFTQERPMKTTLHPSTIVSVPRASVMDCGDKRSAAPLSFAHHAAEERRRRFALPPHSKTWRSFAAPAWCLGVVVVLLAATTHAQTTAFTYQGFLTA